MSATLAPRIEIYTILACSTLKPEYMRFGLSYREDNSTLLVPNPLPGTSPLTPTSFASQDIVHVHLASSPDASDNFNAIADRCAKDPVVQAAVATLTAG
jgi:hypothetical protein